MNIYFLISFISVYFDRTNRFIFDSLKCSKPVLIHCNKGISRSPTIAISYFMKHLNLSYEEALFKIKDIRPFVKPNKGFINQIIKS
jgi:protein-tyrosine phosphatase